MIISRTPFRVSFFGGGTDFPHFYREHGGEVLCTTINKYCYLTVHRLGPYFKHRIRANYEKTEDVQEYDEIQHPLIRECLRYLEFEDGLEIAHVADLPGRTGVGSSSSFTTGLLNALYTYRHEFATAEDLASQAVTIERERVGDPGGHQDQYAIAYGGFSHIRFGPGDGIRVEPVDAPDGRVRALDRSLLMFYTGIERSANTITAEQEKSVDRNLDTLREMRALVGEAVGILARDGSLDPFGDLLHETWERKRRLAAGISNPDVDAAYQAARRAGARGGKLLGAGGRGFLLLYVAEEHRGAVRDALRDLKEVDFHFSSSGPEIILATEE